MKWLHFILVSPLFFSPAPKMVSNALSPTFPLQQVWNELRSSSKSTISSVVIPTMPAPGQHHQGKAIYLTWAPTASIEVISGHAAIQTSLYVRVKAVLCLNHWINILKFSYSQEVWLDGVSQIQQVHKCHQQKSKDRFFWPTPKWKVEAEAQSKQTKGLSRNRGCSIPWDSFPPLNRWSPSANMVLLRDRW